MHRFYKMKYLLELLRSYKEEGERQVKQHLEQMQNYCSPGNGQFYDSGTRHRELPQKETPEVNRGPFQASGLQALTKNLR